MEERRHQKFIRVVAQRQLDLTVILENVWDSHNAGAVIRTCDSVGICEVFVLQTEQILAGQKKLVIGKRTARGASRWVDVHLYTDREACFSHIKNKYERVIGTHLGEASVGLHQLDLTLPTALLFGNERDGISEETMKYCDGNFTIPQMGMAESLNVSVACAVTLYEALRQRMGKGLYGENTKMQPSVKEAIFQDYMERHETKLNARRSFKRKI